MTTKKSLERMTMTVLWRGSSRWPFWHVWPSYRDFDCCQTTIRVLHVCERAWLYALLDNSLVAADITRCKKLSACCAPACAVYKRWPRNYRSFSRNPRFYYTNGEKICNFYHQWWTNSPTNSHVAAVAVHFVRNLAWTRSRLIFFPLFQSSLVHV